MINFIHMKIKIIREDNRKFMAINEKTNESHWFNEEDSKKMELSEGQEFDLSDVKPKVQLSRDYQDGPIHSEQIANPEDLARASQLVSQPSQQDI